jgi:hypothetical protein
VPEPAGARVAHLARSCARFLGRVPLIATDRLSAESAAAMSQCERAVADLLRQAADVLADYAAGVHGADDALVAGCAHFAAVSPELRQGLDGDAALGLLRDVFADVVGDAAKVPPLAGPEPRPVAATAVAAVEAEPSRRSAVPVPATRAARRSRAVAATPRRRPDWQPPAEPES